MSMFCYQCQETAKGTGCILSGVCGKTPEVANMQDLLLFVVRGIAVYNEALRKEGRSSAQADKFIFDALFVTITNANFDKRAIIEKIKKGLELKKDLGSQVTIESVPDECTWYGDESEFEEKAQTVGVLRTPNEDIRSLKEPSLEQYCRWTFDPDLYFNPEAMPIYMKQPVAMPGETTYRERVQTETSPLQRLAPGYERCDALSVLFEAAFARALDEEDGYQPEEGDKQSLLINLAGYCFRAGIPEEDTVRWCRAHYRLPKDDTLVRGTVRNVYRTSEGFASKSSLLPEQLFVMQMDEFMKRRYDFRFNQLTSQVECRERNSFNFYFLPVDKRLMASITMNAQYEGLKLWDKDVVRFLNSDHVPVYQPIEEFLYDLPRWNGKDYIGNLAKRVPCDHPYWTQLFRRWFLSMVAHWRGMGKNHANSTSPILIGPQAYRKSTFCRLILPPCLQAYYTDSIDFSRKRDAELYLNRFLLINMDEFDQIGISQQSFLKHILQKPVVNTRRPNASAVEELRRYASFIGTSNHKDLLTDTSGSRRFIGVEVTGVIDVVRPIDYEQLYAQAMAALRSNERYWFDEKEEAIMTEANREFEQSPAIEQLFQVYYRAAEEEEEGEWLLAADILQRIQKASKMKFSAGQVNYFGRILQRLRVKSFRKTRGVYYHVMPVE